MQYVADQIGIARSMAGKRVQDAQAMESQS